MFGVSLGYAGRPSVGEVGREFYFQVRWDPAALAVWGQGTAPSQRPDVHVASATVSLPPS